MATESLNYFLSMHTALHWVVMSGCALLALLGGLSTSTIAAAQSQSLDYIDFGQPPGEIGSFITDVSGINSDGDVIGYFFANGGNFHSFVVSGRTFHAISFPGSTSTEVLAINDSGQMAGDFYGADNHWHGFLLSGVGGTYTQIDAPGASYARYSGLYVNGMNNLGQLVGYYQDAAPSYHYHSFLYSSGTLSIIGPGDSGLDRGTNAVAINNAGEIIGNFADTAGPDGAGFHGFLLSGNGMTQIDAPGAAETYLVAMSDAGEVLGYSYPTHSDFTYTYFLYDHGRYTIINPPADYSGAQFYGINDFGQIAGYYSNKNCPTSCGILVDHNQTYTGPIIPNGRCPVFDY